MSYQKKTIKELERAALSIRMVVGGLGDAAAVVLARQSVGVNFRVAVYGRWPAKEAAA